MDMHGVMRSADKHKNVHMQLFFNTTCEKETFVRLSHYLEESAWIPTATFQNNHRKCQKENSPGKILAHRARIQRTKFSQLQQRLKEENGYHRHPQCPVVTNDTEWQTKKGANK